MNGAVVALRESPPPEAVEALVAALVDLHTLITLDPLLGASPVRVHFVLNPEAMGRIIACIDADDRRRARSTTAFALVAYDFPFALHIVEMNAPRIEAGKGKEIVTRSAGLQGEALRMAAAASGVEARPAPAFDAHALKAMFFSTTQETVIHLFGLSLREDLGVRRELERAGPVCARAPRSAPAEARP